MPCCNICPTSWLGKSGSVWLMDLPWCLSCSQSLLRLVGLPGELPDHFSCSRLLRFYIVSPLTAWLVLHTTSPFTFHENFFLGRHRPCLPPCDIPTANQIQSHTILPWETNEIAGQSCRAWRWNHWQAHSEPKVSTLETLHQTKMIATCLSP